MKRYILVKGNGESFVVLGHSLTEALANNNAPPENEIIAIVAERWCLPRRGDWRKRNIQLDEI